MSISKSLKDLLFMNINTYINNREDKVTAIDEIISTMEKQSERLNLKLKQLNSEEKEAKIQLDNYTNTSDILSDSAKMALLGRNEDIAKKTLNKKYNSDINKIEKEIIYMTLNAQASQLKEQYETLQYKLAEASLIKESLTSVSLNSKAFNYSKEAIRNLVDNLTESNVKCQECEKSRETLEAEIDRLMQEIKDSHNIK